MTTIDRILQLRDEHHLTSKEVEISAGLANSSISQWKKGRGKPSLDSIVKLSHFFHVSSDYLLCLTDQKHGLVFEISLSEEEQLLLKGYRAARVPERFRVIQICMNALDQKKDEEELSGAG